MMHEYAAIDPIALLFPSRLYTELAEKLHPQVPTSTEIKHALGPLTPEERRYILRRARMLLSYSKAVQEAMGNGQADVVGLGRGRAKALSGVAK